MGGRQVFWQILIREGMKRYMIISVLMMVAAIVIFVGCRTKQASVTSITDISDNRVSEDSMVSASLRSVIDSIVSVEFVTQRDCVVIVVDEQGNTLATSRWQLRDRNKTNEHYGMVRDSNDVSHSKVQRRERKEGNYFNGETYKPPETLSICQKVKITLGSMLVTTIILVIAYIAWYKRRKDRQDE